MTADAGAASWLRVVRIGVGILGVVALAWIPVRDLGAEGFSLANYFSYFTIQSNVLGVVVLLVGGFADPAARRWQVLRGASTLYLVITGVVYATLLAHLDVMLDDRWINDVLHRVLPIVILADWIVAPRRLGITPGLIGAWLAYPAVYAAYTLLRGPWAGWYPYPFLDPTEQGYVSLALGLIVLTMVFALLAVAVAGIGDLRGRRERPPRLS
ncbi:Pr6Pr family membrane protein [Nocardia sp. NPDC024068]|uniref:Pr6Pr family membrane protein n=1 Tax=Nocardia sp. NPDC024068 TaxID=3157197 RepID=UPI0034034C0A